MIKISKYFIPYILIMFMVGFHKSFFISLFWVFVHEFSHALMAKFLGVKKVKIKITPIGFSMTGDEFKDISFAKEVAIVIAGPAANIIIALIFYLIYKSYHFDIFEISMKTNLVLGCFNLLPALPLDGSRLLNLCLQRKYTCKKAHKIKVNTSMIIGALIFSYFIFLVFNKILNISLGLLSFFIINISYKEKGRIVYIIIGDIMKKKVKFLKNRCIENKSLCISYKYTLLETLSLIDKNKYYTFVVLEDDMKVIDIVYEQEIIEGLKSYGNITLDEYIIIRQGNNL
ncbi:M50 family metallopeptidase [Clostridium algidicarnis]|uniref:M50 family metallopeptidase n=2 Tax=Clostridium algidicarnis TaxID=37659 RepID=UPI001C0D13C7|nr:M50 family metallopeptidase [Clostridium algidicarnis]MBU3210875.1 M50 family metallopeptidase [Clostridium algidicarnis]MBU3222617.1 M50 family metallopeptidase [Clostridium algidicarnis]